MIYRPQQDGSRRGVVLLAVLVVVVVLTLAAYEFSELMMAEYKASDSHRRYVQARAMADSGVHYAAALLANPDALANQLGGNPYDNPGMFQGIVVKDSENARSKGLFSIVSPPDPDAASSGQGFRYGVTDECGKINVNMLLKLDSSGDVATRVLGGLPNMTEEIANSILDWIDADEDTRSSGAESEYYSGLNPSYRCKNGPLDSLEELLLVKGVTPDLLFGNDRNRNGILDPDEDDGSGSANMGWSAYLTVHSREQNVDSTGAPRIYVNDTDLDGLMTKLSQAVGEDLANYIIAYRLYGGQSQSQNGNQQGGGQQGGSSGGSSGGSPSGGGGGGGGGAAPMQQQPKQQQPQQQPQSSRGQPSNTRNTGQRSPTPSAPSSPSPAPNSGGGGGGGGGGAGGGGQVSKQPLSRGSINTRSGQPKSISSLYELINSTVTIPGQNGQQGTTYASPLNDVSTMKQLLPLLLDKVTTVRDAELPARVNVNTAPSAVLAALPGLSESDVQAMIEHGPRASGADPSDPVYQTPAWLITEANLQPSTLKTLEKYITGRSQVYRVQVVGYYEGGGPSVRVEAVIDTNAGRPRVSYWRDLTELGRGFDLGTNSGN